MGWSDYVNESNVACASRGKAKCLALAYNERAEFAGLSAMSENGLLTDYQLDVIIPKFGRIINGSFVAYTLTSIYEELGEERIDTRLAAFRGNNRYSAEWLEQVIRVINKLLISYVQLGKELIQSESSVAWKYAESTEIIENPDFSTGDMHFSHHTYYIKDYGILYPSYSTKTICKLWHPVFRNSTKILNISAFVGWRFSDPNIFNSGTSGFSQGFNLLFENIEVEIDTNGYFRIPPIPGESLDNFCESEPSPWPENIFNTSVGYTINNFYMGGVGNFEFVEGS